MTTKTQTRQTKDGRRWLAILSTGGGQAFLDEARRLADAAGVDRTAPDCRVIRGGRKVWVEDGPIT